MKTLFLTLLVFVCAWQLAFTQHPFYDGIDREVISSNFNGACYDGKNMLIYGAGGLIIRSEDEGQNWMRVNLNDSLYFTDIVYTENRLIGLCARNSAIISQDGGKTWQLKKLGENLRFQRLLLRNDTLFALSNEGIFMMNPNLEIIRKLNFEAASNCLSMTLLGDEIAMLTNDASLLLLNMRTRKQSGAALSTFVQETIDNKQIAPIMSDGISKIYILYAADLYVFDIKSYTGSKVGSFFYKNGVATYNSGAVYHLASNTPTKGEIYDIYCQKYTVSDNSIAHIKSPGVDRYLTGVIFRNIQFLTSNIVIATGASSFAYISYDGGKKWRTISKFNSFGAGSYAQAINSKQIRCLGNNGLFTHSDDGGATWLPQRDFSEKYMYKSQTKFWKDAKNGFYYKIPDHLTDTNVIITNDGGETTRMIYWDDGTGNENWATYVIAYDNDYVFITSKCRSKNSDCWSVVLRVNDSFYVTRRVPIRDWQIIYATNIGGIIYALGYDRTEADSLMSVFSSSDGGKEWEKNFSFAVEKSVFSPELKINTADNLIFMSFSYWPPNTNNTYVTCYKIDPIKKTAKKILSPITSGTTTPFFNIGSRFYTSIRHWGLSWLFELDMLYTDDINADSIIWHNIEHKRYSTPIISNFESDSLFVFEAMDTSATIPLTYLGRAKKPATSVDEPFTEMAASAMYISSPRPNPSRSETSMRLYWNASLNIEDAEFTAYNVLGMIKSQPSDFRFTVQNAYSGELTWNTSGKSPGAYFVRFRIGENSTFVPIIVE